MSKPSEPAKEEVPLNPNALPGLLPGGTLDPVFRSGSLTAISVVLGFSLSFLNRWAGGSGDWHIADMVSLGLIICGATLQLKSLIDLLLVSSLLPEKYHQSIKYFCWTWVGSGRHLGSGDRRHSRLWSSHTWGMTCKSVFYAPLSPLEPAKWCGAPQCRPSPNKSVSSFIGAAIIVNRMRRLEL